MGPGQVRSESQWILKSSELKNLCAWVVCKVYFAFLAKCYSHLFVTFRSNKGLKQGSGPTPCNALAIIETLYTQDGVNHKLQVHYLG